MIKGMQEAHRCDDKSKADLDKNGGLKQLFSWLAEDPLHPPIRHGFC